MTCYIRGFSVPSAGNVLVHEWAKFRWGVFEEYGHLHDAIFPQVYRDDNNTATPTYCTDTQLEGTMVGRAWSAVDGRALTGKASVMFWCDENSLK
ncbi:hypothetical protein E2C01_097608 [Portunus trituberculatus]|uniref:Calcium-activated chloride channel N-terminal domain-containing protein n=1 Tax=Portunus trituberculatus TaxID=210409 RepID=A0A5B7K0U6_PORTR|nr:hypothetical protein [Portunus trituberculatus]